LRVIRLKEAKFSPKPHGNTKETCGHQRKQWYLFNFQLQQF